MSKLDKSTLNTPFSPNPFNSHLTDSLRGIPIYLFRVSDPLSPGTTNQTEVCSAAAQNSPEQPHDLYQMLPEQAARLLETHLRWECSTSSLSPCNLVSWTSSLLVALQYGFYCHGRNWGSQQLSEIKILMVDTRQFACNMFARDLQVLAAFRGNSQQLQTLYEWRNSGLFYPGEYFSQGRLVIDPERSCQVSMQELMDCGLFNVCPGLSDETHWSRWAKRVNELRREMECQLPPIKARNIQAVIDVTKAFKHFELPSAFILLGIIPYDLSDGVSTILEVFLKNYSGKPQPKSNLQRKRGP
ncbi:hypothetical protein CSUB01_10392 [Colletotrichum sublineola]|uniref:DUF7587 domain-containing protein n=1 Tax=Colletotrichum sublineola TaxID=1173701 RepID=A0A066X9Y9_COLSU|nr:hypothetical protein CSUB01_10392 [Colletotrichum sublineola]